MENISIMKPQCMAQTYNTYQICGCLFNCIWTESNNYLWDLICGMDFMESDQ